MSTLPRHEKPRPHYANGLCEMHYRQERRKKPECKAADCKARLKPAHSRQGYCRMHEHLLLKEPLRKPEAIDRTLDNFLAGITPTLSGLPGLFGCWPWTGRRNKVALGSSGEPVGYGVISIGNHDWLAHRYSYGNFIGGHRNGLTLDHVCRNSLCVRPDHLMPMTQRRNSELEHRRALDDPEAVLRDLAKIPEMRMETMLWAMLNGLPISRATPGGKPFAYGLDGEPFNHRSGPAEFPAVAELFRT
ncbi:HNH endonuclease [Arthrobacter sp. efr-133-TYG-120]|uniref:HNH endonuclease n=1 Tax=Arthrobacter sp. efr-133-TYG-120 TaxID=3040280 RepID=UPI00254AB554|nr:HNH endonuclease [Arthrobacter sp. efr-133-TYG-120]